MELTERELDELIRRYPLPEGVVDVVMNREELAEALATSLNTISAWINSGMPVEQHGGPGKAYELRLSRCWAWRQWKKSEEDRHSQEVKAATAAMRLALVGGESGDSIEALDPKQRREIIAAQIEHEKLLMQRRQLMRREDVGDLLEQLFTIIRDTMEAAPDRVERAQPIPAKAVLAFIEICDGLVDEVRGRVVNFWELNREDRRPDRKDLFDA